MIAHCVNISDKALAVSARSSQSDHSSDRAVIVHRHNLLEFDQDPHPVRSIEPVCFRYILIGFERCNDFVNPLAAELADRFDSGADMGG